MRGKVEYVRDRMKTPARGHHCHWPGCERKVPPALWGCRQHWYMLPIDLRTRVWRLTRRPSWIDDKLPLAAGGFEAARYRKDD